MDGDHAPLQAGTLYLIATPIGNLEDITLRAIRTLKECDVIAAEDTRRSGQLLRHLGFSKPLLSYFQFNEAKRSEEILERLKRGQKVGLISDAGSPGISDPGERVVKAAIAAGFRVESVPGPSAAIAALTASGLPTDEFHFVGFLPHKSGQRKNRLEALKNTAGSLVLYESPYRIIKLLNELNEVFPDREIVLARELTKKFEQYTRGTPGELLKKPIKEKGEFVVLISPEKNESAAGTRVVSGQSIPILPSVDLDATLEFYKKLGFEILFEQRRPDIYAILELGDIELHFFGHPELRPKENDAGCYIRTEDVSKLHEQWRLHLPEKGIPRLTTLEVKPWGMLEFALVDLNGNLLRVGIRVND